METREDMGRTWDQQKQTQTGAMNGQTPERRRRLYTQTLMKGGGTGEVEQQVGTLWLMSSTLNSLTQTGGDKHAPRRRGKTEKHTGHWCPVYTTGIHRYFPAVWTLIYMKSLFLSQKKCISKNSSQSGDFWKCWLCVAMSTGRIRVLGSQTSHCAPEHA